MQLQRKDHQNVGGFFVCFCFFFIYFIIIFILLLQNTVPASPSAWFCGIALAEISQPGEASLVQKAHHQNG